MKDKTGWNKYRRKQPREQEPRETELVIEQLTNAGDGLGRQDQRVVFVPYTLPGDRVRIRITQRKKSYALATVIELLKPGEDRIDAPCHWFGSCGGCSWQHVPYLRQLEAKSSQLRETLTRIGMLDELPIEPIVPSKQIYGYRNRIQGEISHGQFHYKWPRSDQRIAVDRCDIAEDSINEYLQTDLTQALQGRVEIAVVDGEVTVAPVNDRNSTELGFRQVNTAVSEHLTARLLETVAQSECSRVMDLYCGRGHWTNQIGETHPDKHVVGVDSSEDNIRQARTQAGARHLANVTFHQATVERSLNKLVIGDSLCIVDPPRAGLDTRVTDALVSDPCQELVYVSCHPATLARDLKQLTASAYHIQTIVPLDMFPQTAHLETLVLLQRR